MGWDGTGWDGEWQARVGGSALRCAASRPLRQRLSAWLVLSRPSSASLEMGSDRDWDWSGTGKRLCYCRTGGQEDSPVSLFPLLLSLDLFGRFDRACRESTPVSRRRWDETPDPYQLGRVEM